MSKRALLVSYAFPPMAGPNAYLAAKVMGNLPGWEVDVVCAENWIPGNEERSLDRYATERFGKICRLSLPTWARYVPYRYIPALGRLPDNLVALRARLRAMLGTIDLDQYDAIVTWSQWHSAHEAGLLAKRSRPDLRWVAYFSDPWTDNPYVDYGPITRRLNRRWERKVHETADAIVYTSPETADLVLDNHSEAVRQKTRVIPHPVDPTLYPERGVTAPDGHEFVHLGAFYGMRSPIPLMRALGQLYESNPHVLEGARFVSYGQVVPEIRRAAEKIGLPEGLWEWRESVDYLTSLGLMKGAAGLYLVDAPLEPSPFLPSKLVDYIGAGRPILGVSPPGTTRRELDTRGHWTADPRDPHSLERALRDFIEAATKWPHRTLNLPPDDPFHVGNVCHRFSTILDRDTSAALTQDDSVLQMVIT